jgi:hypothetical protein
MKVKLLLFLNITVKLKNAYGLFINVFHDVKKEATAGKKRLINLVGNTRKLLI